METTLHNHSNGVRQPQREQQTVPSVRVETVADPELNRRLFQLYQALIAPVKSIEDAVVSIDYHRERIEQLKHYNFVPRFFMILLKVGLLCLLLPTVGELEWLPVQAAHDHFYQGHHSILGTLALWGGLILIIFLNFVASCMIAELIRKYVNKTLSPRKQPEIDQEEQKIAALEWDIRKTVNNISSAISFVPPAYRTSDALSYFVEAYHNSRVDNLKEAVNAYNAHLEAEQTRSLLRKQIAALEEIQYQNAAMMSQLDNLRYEIDELRSDVWFSSAMSW